MIYWNRVIGYEGDEETLIPLLPYEQSLITGLLQMLIDNPEQYLVDYEDVDLDDMRLRLDNLLNRIMIYEE